MSFYRKELNKAVDIVRKSSLITEWFRKKGFSSSLKQDQSPVTIADLASQVFIINSLRKTFPKDQIIAEEENIPLLNEEGRSYIQECFDALDIQDIISITENVEYRGVTSERQWTIDPIDGTVGFQKGLIYAIGVGLMVKCIPTICAIAVPNYKKRDLAIFSAEKGKGAQASYDGKNFKKISVSHQENVNKASFYHSLHYDQPWVKEFIDIAKIKKHFQIDSMAKFCMVADGSADLYIKPLDINHSYVWDFLPGDLIVREAGGKITDLNGKDLKFKDNKCLWTAPGIIASNGKLQDSTLDYIKKIEINKFI